MISFKSKGDSIASVAILTALLVMVIAIVLQFLPKPTAASMAKGAETSRNKLQDEVQGMKDRTVEEQAKVDAQLWQYPIDQIGPKALQTVSGFVKTAKLKLVAFRPQKAVEVNGLTQIPFLISVEGGYPGMMELLRQLDKPDAKIATNNVQLTSTDSNSDLVTGTIVAMAYTQEKPTVKAKTEKTKKAEDKSQEKPNAKKEN